VQAMAGTTPVAAIVGDSAPEVADRVEHVSLVAEFGRELALAQTRTCIERAARLVLERG